MSKYYGDCFTNKKIMTDLLKISTKTAMFQKMASIVLMTMGTKEMQCQRKFFGEAFMHWATYVQNFVSIARVVQELVGGFTQPPLVEGVGPKHLGWARSTIVQKREKL